MTTLHANNSYNALNRIINFFPRDMRDAVLADLSIGVRCVISQRLVRTGDGRRVPAVEVANLRAGAVQALSGGHHHARRSAGQLRFAHQPALADRQRHDA